MEFDWQMNLQVVCLCIGDGEKVLRLGSLLKEMQQTKPRTSDNHEDSNS